MVVRQKLGYIIWITYYMKVFYLFYEKIMKYVCSFTHGSNLCPVPIGNFSILPKWHFWTHAWNSKKLFWPKDFIWGNQYESAIYKNIHNLFQGLPNPGFRSVNVQAETFLTNDTRDFKNSFYLWILWIPSNAERQN